MFLESVLNFWPFKPTLNNTFSDIFVCHFGLIEPKIIILWVGPPSDINIIKHQKHSNRRGHPMENNLKQHAIEIFGSSLPEDIFSYSSLFLTCFCESNITSGDIILSSTLLGLFWCFCWECCIIKTDSQAQEKAVTHNRLCPNRCMGIVLCFALSGSILSLLTSIIR